MEITKDNLQYWKDRAQELKNQYYSKKQHCNHTSDPHQILSWWNAASSCWDKASEIEKAIKKFENETV